MVSYGSGHEQALNYPSGNMTSDVIPVNYSINTSACLALNGKHHCTIRFSITARNSEIN